MARTIAPVAVALGLAAVGGPARGQLSDETIAAVKPATVFIKFGPSSGSGFVVKVDGPTTYVVTNHHVIDPEDFAGEGKTAPPYNIIFDSGEPTERRVRATVVAADPERDLAVLKMPSPKNPPAPLDLADPPALRLTMPVFVCGFPFGTRLAAEEGQNPSLNIGPASVSGIRRDKFGQFARIPLNGALNPGNSGGPVVDDKGKLVGVAVTTLTGRGVGFAVHHQEVTRMLRGRAGAVKLHPPAEPDGDLKLEVTLLDPFKTVKGITAHVRPATRDLSPEPIDGEPTVPAGGTAVPMVRSGDKATAAIRPKELGRKGLLVQVAVEVADGVAVTPPEVLSPDAPKKDVETGPGGAPRFRLPNGFLMPLPARKRPTPPPGATILSDVNVEPAKFVDQTVQVDALSPLRIAEVDGVYQFDMETDSGELPTDLRVIAPKDLGLQLHDIGLSDLPVMTGMFKFAVRVKATVKKPAGKGRDARHVLEVSEVGFLDPQTGAVASTLKVETAPPAGPPTLSAVNRFPEAFKGKPFVVKAQLVGASFAGTTTGLTLHNEMGAPPLNLKFYVPDVLAKRIDADVPKTDPPMAKVYATVERVDADTGVGVIGVSKVETLNEAGSVERTFESKNPIQYPPVKVKPTPAVAAPKAPKPDTPEKKDGGPSTLLIVGVAGGFALIAAAGVTWWMLRKQSAAAPKYGAAKADAAQPAPSGKLKPPAAPASGRVKPAAAPPAKAAPRPVAKPAPAARPKAPPPPPAGGGGDFDFG